MKVAVLTKPLVLIDLALKGRELTGFHNIALALLGSLFIALTAQITIPLPFSPVPITGQTFGVLVTGAVLGAKRGGLSALFYLIEGAMGMPVFAGFMGGLHHLVGPTGGYLIGFVPAAYLAGYLAEKGWDRSVYRSVVAMAMANSIIYIAGLSVLALYTGFAKAPVLGLYPFVAGDLLKVALAALSMPLVWKAVTGKGR